MHSLTRRKRVSGKGLLLAVFVMDHEAASDDRCHVGGRGGHDRPRRRRTMTCALLLLLLFLLILSSSSSFCFLGGGLSHRKAKEGKNNDDEVGGEGRHGFGDGQALLALGDLHCRLPHLKPQELPGKG